MVLSRLGAFSAPNAIQALQMVSAWTSMSAEVAPPWPKRGAARTSSATKMLPGLWTQRYTVFGHVEISYCGEQFLKCLIFFLKIKNAALPCPAPKHRIAEDEVAQTNTAEGCVPFQALFLIACFGHERFSNPHAIWETIHCIEHK